VREAFEAWYGKGITRDDAGDYDGHTYTCWRAWQAALAHASSAAVKDSLTAHSSSDFDELHDLAKWFRERGDELNSVWLEKIAKQYVAPATCKEVLQVGENAEECSVDDHVAGGGKLVDAAVLAELTAWLTREMPAGTIIGSPEWWAKRIAGRVHIAIDQAIAGRQGDEA